MKKLRTNTRHLPNVGAALAAAHLILYQIIKPSKQDMAKPCLFGNFKPPKAKNTFGYF
jgi:hypothetical protein